MIDLSDVKLKKSTLLARVPKQLADNDTEERKELVQDIWKSVGIEDLLIIDNGSYYDIVKVVNCE